MDWESFDEYWGSHFGSPFFARVVFLVFADDA
jgi:hypothetical protein